MPGCQIGLEASLHQAQDQAVLILAVHGDLAVELAAGLLYGAIGLHQAPNNALLSCWQEGQRQSIAGQRDLAALLVRLLHF